MVRPHRLRSHERGPRADRPQAGPPYNPLAGASDIVKNNTLGVSFEPDKFTALVSRVAPRFSTIQAGNGVWLLKEHAGRATVLKPTPPSKASRWCCEAFCPPPRTVRSGYA